MAQAFRHHPTLADLVALNRAIERDETKTREELLARDRAIVASLPATFDTPLALPLAWLDRVAEKETAVSEAGANASAAQHWVGLLLTLTGVLTGLIVASGTFYYEGGDRVNVLSVLGVFVILPALLLIPFVLACVPPRWLGWLPGAQPASTMSRGLSPGRLGFALARFLPQDLRNSLTRLAADLKAHEQLRARLQKWTIVRWSQIYAVGFQTAALFAVLAMVAFTDLVFGWSTTLASGDAASDAQRVHRIVEVMAAPWQWTGLGETPSIELIAESRFYRVVSEPVTVAQATRLGGWWSFLMLAMFVYGLLPRLITLAIAHWRWRKAVRTAFELVPGLPPLVRRLHTARLQTGADDQDHDVIDATVESRPVTSPAASAPTKEVAAIVNWAGVPLADEKLRETWGEVPVFAAGGAATLDADRDVARRLRDLEVDAEREIAIIVKAWEPPLLELVDFLQHLRETLGRGRTISVHPIRIDESNEPGTASVDHLRVWRRRLSQIGDPWLRVVAQEEEIKR